jgi:hypothetical protein
MRFTSRVFSAALLAASSANAQVYMVRADGQDIRPHAPVVLTCLEDETRPDTGAAPTLQMRVDGALAAPVRFGHAVYVGSACVTRFEEAAEENGWSYVITPVE